MPSLACINSVILLELKSMLSSWIDKSAKEMNEKTQGTAEDRVAQPSSMNLLIWNDWLEPIIKEIFSVYR